MSIQRSYKSSVGTLTAFYSHNVAKEKNKLDHFSFLEAGLKVGETTQIALSKVWVNGVPASHLKGFKSYVLPENGVQFALSQDVYEVTVPGAHFNMLSLTIKISEDKEETLTLQVPERLTFLGLKKIVSKKLAIPDFGRLDIQYQGNSLDANNTLEECGFENGTELTLRLSSQEEDKVAKQEKATAGALEMFSAFSFVIADTPKTIPTTPVTKDTPIWRHLHKGLSLKAPCTNKVCKAFQKTVYIPKRMGTFNMAKECCEATCPACDKPFEKEVSNCGFWDCIYSIQGMMKDGTRFNEQNKTAPKDRFLTFEEVANGVSKIARWKYLEITTKPSV